MHRQRSGAIPAARLLFVVTLAGCSANGGQDKPSAEVIAACEEHCACVGFVCSDVPDLVNDGFDDCVDMCVTWDDTEGFCATKWCEFPMLSLPYAFRQHACTHALLMDGVDECLGLISHDAVSIDPPETSVADGSAADGEPSDVASDAGASDAGLDDAGSDDVALADAVTADAAPDDAGAHDAGPADAAADTAEPDAAPDDGGVVDAGGEDAGADLEDTSAFDAGSDDAGAEDVAEPDAAIDASDASDAADEDAGPAVEPATCTDYCDCMMSKCVTQMGFPFADKAACMSACAGYESTALQCWASFCVAADTVTTASLVEHACSHAWGSFQLDECAFQGWKALPFDECIFEQCIDTAIGCAKVDGCSDVGVCMAGCGFEKACIDDLCKKSLGAAALNAFEPVLVCAEQKGCYAAD